MSYQSPAPSTSAPKNMVQGAESAGPPAANAPRAPFPSNLVLTLDQELALDQLCDEWYMELTNSSGWTMTGGEENWMIEGLQEATDDRALDELNRRHFVKRAYYQAISENRWEYRRWAYGADSVFSRSNLNAPLCRRISRAMAAKAITGFFGTKPHFVCYPVGPSDEQLAESLQVIAENKMDVSKGTAALRDAMNASFDLGECVLKVKHRRRTDLYRKNDTVLADAAGNIVLGADGEYISRGTQKIVDGVETWEGGDLWVMAAAPVAEPAAPGMAPLEPPLPVKLLKRDGVTAWPQGAQWMYGNFARTITHYAGPDIEHIFYRNFLANWDAPTLQEADCCIHLFEVTPAELAAMFTDAKGTNLLQSIDLLQKAGQVDPVSLGSDFAASTAGAPKSKKIKVREHWIRCDVDGDGVTEDICYVRVQIGGEWIPLFYDYVQNVTETKQRPFYSVTPCRRKGRWTGIGAIEMFEKHQEVVDLMLNRWAFSTSSSGRITAYDPNAFERANGEAVDLRLNTGEALKLKTGFSLEKAVQVIYLEDNIGEHWLKIFETFLQLAMNESGVQHANDGGMAGMDTTKLATGIRNVERAGNENFAVFMACLEDGVEDVVRAFVQTLFARIEVAEVARTMEGKVPTEWTVTPRQVEGMQFDVKVMLSKYRSEQMLESVRAVLPDCVTFYTTLPPIAQVRLAPLFIQMLKAAQITNADKIIVPMPEVDPAMVQQATDYALSLPPEVQQALAPLIQFAASAMPPEPAGQPQQPAAV